MVTLFEKSATKRFWLDADGSICMQSYGHSTYFTVSQESPSDIDELSTLLTGFEVQSDIFLIRGIPDSNVDFSKRVRRRIYNDSEDCQEYPHTRNCVEAVQGCEAMRIWCTATGRFRSSRPLLSFARWRNLPTDSPKSRHCRLLRSNGLCGATLRRSQPKKWP